MTDNTKRGRLAIDDPKWCFQLRGNDFWLWDFVRNLNSIDIRLFADHEDGQPTIYFMTSPHLTGLNAAEATSRAQQLLVLLNGALQLNEGLRFMPFKLGGCVELDEMRPAFIPYGEHPSMKPFPDDVQNLRYRNPSHPLDYFGALFFLSRSDAQLMAVLQILGAHGITLGSLSQVLDTIEGAMRDSFPKEKDRITALATYGKKKPGDLKNFSYMANSFAVSGIDARHGLDEKFGVSDRLDVLSLEQATDVVLSCTRGFVEMRAAETFSIKFREAVLM